MLFKIKEKFWSWGGDEFTITDDSDTARYLVKGKAFSWGDDLSFQTADGLEVAHISQKLLSWKPRYQIRINGELFAEVIKEFSWFKKKFTLDVPGPNDYTITGSFWSHEFIFERSGREVARASKKWGWADTYGVEIEEGEEVVPILGACIVIDQVLDDEVRSGNA